MKKLLKEIEAYLTRTNMPAVWFGPCIGLSRQFVTDLRRDVSTSVDNAEKARTFITRYPSKEAAGKALNRVKARRANLKTAA